MTELFRPDSPISHDSQDRFQRAIFAKRIAEIVSTGHHPSSLTVGVYGKWGEGKSSVLRLVENQLEGKAVVIRFNPWQFQHEDHLLRAFFASIAKALGKQIGKGYKQIALS